jgi:hypothetical protein
LDNFDGVLFALGFLVSTSAAKFLRNSCDKDLIILLRLESSLQMLGWFHEVTSFGQMPTPTSSTESERSSTRSSAATHLALNFWFYPPDAVCGSSEVSRPQRSRPREHVVPIASINKSKQFVLTSCSIWFAYYCRADLRRRRSVHSPTHTVRLPNLLPE